MAIAEKILARHEDIKKAVENAAKYFSENAERYHRFKKLVFKTTLEDAEKGILRELGKPEIEFNILNPYISRLVGEFSKQQPSIDIHARANYKVDEKLIEVIENHLRHIMWDGDKTGAQVHAYKDILSGGYSTFKVWTEYESSLSFKQVIKYNRVEPTMCGFDPLAKLPHKGDGRFAFECYPLSKEDFKRIYPSIDPDQFKFSAAIDGFAWSYSANQEDVIILCDYYERKKRKKRIVELATGDVMEYDKYKELVEMWNESGIIEQAPAIVGKPRWTEFEYICRYVLVENQIIDYVETDYRYLPIVFVDGDSSTFRNGSSFEQFTKPYVYHALDAQRLKNFAGQTWANEIENMVMHKFKVAKESLPDEPGYREAYTNIQRAKVLIYNAFDPDNTSKQLPPPMEIQRVGTPPEVMQAFGASDQAIQNILGSYDAALGINQNQLSGVAIVEAATQSNATAMPYLVNYMLSLTQVGQIILDLIPKYYKTPRTIPITDRQGKKGYLRVNDQGAYKLEYDIEALEITVEAGVAFNIQKDKALNQIIALTQASQSFADFMNKKGLPIILDNIDIKGIELLKDLSEEYQQEMKEEQQQAQQQVQQAQQQQMQMMQQQIQAQQVPLMLEAKIAQQQAEVSAAKVGVDKQNADTNRIKVMAMIGEEQDKIEIQKMKMEAEETHVAVEAAIKQADMMVKTGE